MAKYKLEYEITVRNHVHATTKAIRIAAPFIFENLKHQIYEEYGVIIDFVVNSKLERID